MCILSLVGNNGLLPHFLFFLGLLQSEGIYGKWKWEVEVRILSPVGDNDLSYFLSIFGLLQSEGLCSALASLCAAPCAPSPDHPSLFLSVDILFVLCSKKQ